MTSQVAHVCSPARLQLRKILQWIVMCIAVYMLLTVVYTRLSPLHQHSLPMSVREFYQRINIEEDKWVVTYLPMTWKKGITHLINIPNWSTIIVGEDNMAPQKCKIPKCFYVGPLEMDLIGFAITKYLKGGQRILIGQMIAVILGAEQILPLQIDRVPLESLSNMDAVAKTSGLVHAGSSVFNPYNFKRFPLSTDHIFKHAQRIRPLLQAARRDKNVQKSTNKDKQSIFHMSLKSYVSLNNVDIIYNHDAFWSMLHPVLHSVLGYAELDSFWLQKFIHLIGRTVSVYPTISTPHPQSNSTFPKLSQIDPFVADVIESLDKFKCKSGVVQITKCLENLFRILINRKLFPSESVDIIDSYMSDLKAINYHFPVVEYIPLSNDYDFKVYLSTRANPNPPKRSLMKHINPNKICPGRKFQWHNPRILDILLIITFNKPEDYAQLPVLEFMYRRWFQHIMYCGPNIQGFTEVLASLKFPSHLLDVYFVDGMDSAGLFIQKCMMAAMVVQFNVKGYMQMKVDTLLNPWSIVNLPRDKILLTGNMGEIDATKDKMKYWNWWGEKCGKAAWTKFFSVMQKTKATEDLSKSFLDIFKNNTKPNTAYYSGWNLFYIPSNLCKNFVHAAHLTLTSGLMNELALPAIVLGLQYKAEFHRIKDTSLWGDDSLKYNVFYNTSNVFLYQFNLKSEIKTQKGKGFLCDTYLKYSELKLKIKA